MANQKRAERPAADGGTTDLKQDEIIARLVPDPAAPPDVIAMVGFLGKSSRPRFWRLYQTPDLKDYVELAEDDIVQSQSLKTDFQPLGGTVLWAKSGARLYHSRSESRVAEAEFIHGDITRQFLPGTGIESLTGRGRGGFGVLYSQVGCPASSYPTLCLCLLFRTQNKPACYNPL